MAAIVVGLMLPASVAVAADLIPTSLDLEAPAAVELGEPLTLTATVSPDPGGGWITFSVDGTPELTTQVPLGGVISFTFDDGLSYYGQHMVAVTYNGNATHNGSYDQALIDVLDDRTPVTVSLTSSPNPALRGEPITFSVGVSPNPHGGDIELRHGGSQLEVGSLGGNGQATLVTSFGGSGSIEIEACFVGNDTHQQACSPPLDQVVHGITSTTALAIEPATVYPDESITVGVTVSPAPETATTVWVGTSPSHNLIPVGLSGPAGYGQVTLTSDVLDSLLVLGHQYDLRAYFPGTAQLEPSTSNLVQFLIRLDEPTLVTSVDPGVHHVGDPLTFSASVSPLPIVEEAGVGFRVSGPAMSGFGDNIGVELGLDGTGQTTVDTDGWPAGDYWYDAGCCGDPHLAPTTERGFFTLIDEDAPAGDLSVADGASTVVSAGVEADVPATDGVGSGVQVVALSNDGSTWTSMPYAALVDWSLAGGDGTHTVRAKWQDQAGNWSPIRSDTVILDTHGPTGSVSLAGGAAATRTRAVTVAVPANDATTGLSHVALSNDGVAWTTRSYAASQSWTLSSGDGTKTVRVKWKDAAGNWSPVKTDTIVLDTVAPSATEPRRGLVAATNIDAGRITLRVPWSGTDATSGIARYELLPEHRRRSMDGGLDDAHQLRPPTARWRACTRIASGYARWTRPATSGHGSSGRPSGCRATASSTAPSPTAVHGRLCRARRTGAARPAFGHRRRTGDADLHRALGRMDRADRSQPRGGDGLRQRHQGRHGRPVLPGLWQPARRMGTQLVDLGRPYRHASGWPAPAAARWSMSTPSSRRTRGRIERRITSDCPGGKAGIRRFCVVRWGIAALRGDAPRGRSPSRTGRASSLRVREVLEVLMTTGTIKKVVADRGFGFISAEDEKEYFFHRGGLDASLDFDRLVGGEPVVFDVEQSPKGPRANNVRSA